MGNFGYTFNKDQGKWGYNLKKYQLGRWCEDNISWILWKYVVQREL